MGDKLSQEQRDARMRVVVGEDVVSLFTAHSSSARVAGILGYDRDASGAVVRIYLDRLVHRPDQRVLGEWHVYGAVSTVLSAGNTLHGAERDHEQ